MMRGLVRRTIFWLVVLPVLALHRVAFWLDEILFPSLRHVRVTKPLFVVGLPRSGTTLAHRLLASQRETFTTFPLWELVLAPALIEKYALRWLQRADRAIGGPLHWLVDRIQRGLAGSLESIHPTGLGDPEEDYLGLLPFGGCFLQVLVWPHSDATWELVHFADRMSPERRRKLLRIYHGILIRHLRFRGESKHLLSKNPSLTSWIPGLLEMYPDGCIVALRRDLRESLPSQLSSLRDGFEWFGHNVSDPRIVERFCELYVSNWMLLDPYVGEPVSSGAGEAGSERDRHRVRVTGYDKFMEDRYGMVCTWLESFGYRTTDQDRVRLQQLCERSATYRSAHRYQSSEFGLTPNRLAELVTMVGRHDSPALTVSPLSDTATARLSDA